MLLYVPMHAFLGCLLPQTHNPLMGSRQLFFSQMCKLITSSRQEFLLNMIFFLYLLCHSEDSDYLMEVFDTIMIFLMQQIG